MKYYNRDDYERNLESYEVPEYFTKGARNEFVYGFIVGAVIGSAIGLVSLSKTKAKDKTTPKPDESSQFKSHIIEQSESEKANADRQVSHIKSTVSSAQDNEVSTSALTAQKNAIQQETSDNNLADMSPDAQAAQEQQGVDNGESKDTDPTHIDAQAQPTKDEVDAQQAAIKEEVTDNDSASTSATSNTDPTHIDAQAQPTKDEVDAQQTAIKEEVTDKDNDSTGKGTKIAAATGGTIAATGIAKAASDKKQALNENEQVAKNTKSLQQEESSSNSKEQAPHLVTKDSKESEETTSKQSSKKTAIASSLTATGLALAAKNKYKAINENQNVADNTANLLKPEAVKSNNNKVVPHLVAGKVDHAVESTNKVDNSADKSKKQTFKSKPEPAEQRVKQTHESVTFNDGIIAHDQAGNGLKKQSTQDSKSKQGKSAQTYTKNRAQSKKTEKAKSKIDKRTFND
ncbi:hypothetical protein BU068_07425 [Staphylococcus succinus]|uniref:hypothetical protein n=1 Tax=Staphylococcus succinus TaxID=61015 RepID=UPI000E685247|nr:hypothetical protein [Staphylococcus succinus]RIN33772.1 hypothetical protein BU068_07425 [Staphylococcus succinus]